MAEIGFKIFIFFFVNPVSVIDIFENRNRFAIKIIKTYKEHIKEILEEYNFEWIFQITPETSIIEYKGEGQAASILKMLSGRYKHKIITWEPVRDYSNTLETAQSTFPSEDTSVGKINYGKQAGQSLPLNHTGEGVTIAISSIGVNKNLINLETNIRNSLKFDFAKPGGNVKFARLHETTFVKNHGIINANHSAAVTVNPLCSAERTNNATQAVLNIYEVNFRGDQPVLQTVNWTKSGIMSRADVHILVETDIFVNAWSTTEPFQIIDLSTQEIIEYSAKEGRRGQGTIYLVPAGPPGNGLSNNIDTITVGSIERNRDLPFNVDASVITSALSEEINLTSCSALTTSFKNKCISSYSCLSAATAQIAGVIALGLQANRNLSVRDIQHLLVQASEHQDLKDQFIFKRNGAGKMFHDMLGFGLLNPSKFITLCNTKEPVSDLMTVTLDLELNRTSNERNLDVQFFYNCKSYEDDDCIISVENILVSVELKIDTNNLTLAVISPAGTESLLIKQVKPDFTTGHFVTNHFWEELPLGIWTVRMQGTEFTAFFEMTKVSVTIYGNHRSSNIYSTKDWIDHDFVFTYILISTGAVVILTGTALFVFWSKKNICRQRRKQKKKKAKSTKTGKSLVNIEIKHDLSQPNATTSDRETKITFEMEKSESAYLKMYDNPETMKPLLRYPMQK